MTMQELFQETVDIARRNYSENEAKCIAWMLLEDYWGIRREQMLLEPSSICPNKYKPTQWTWEEVLQQLEKGRPIQYIIGEVEFCGFSLRVNEATLIPRPETEELVSWIARENQGEKGTLLDVGTGSGAIAIALAKQLPRMQVTATDCSAEALAIATQNAMRNEVAVCFIKDDIRATQLTGNYKLIVSNPPYVTCSEQALMRKNVLDYEPHLALFVPDTDPLLFYRTIASFAAEHLFPKGWLFFEINENFPKEVAQLLLDIGFTAPRIRSDIFDKPRMIAAQWNPQ